MSYVKVTIEVRDANGRDGEVTLQKPILAGDTIPKVIETTAKRAADNAWDKVRLPPPTIEYSEAAAVAIRGIVYSPFQRNSYTARVKFGDSYSWVIVALPPNARRYSEKCWDARVEEHARRAKDQDSAATLMENGVTP